MTRLYYCARSHTWLRHCGTRLRIGLTRRGLEDVGDVHTVAARQKPGTSVAPGVPLLSIGWDALKISDADELYHTTWSAVEGETIITSPVVADVVGHSTAKAIDEEDWLVELRLPCADGSFDTNGLLSEAAYTSELGRVGASRGRFGEDGTLTAGNLAD